MGWVEKTQKGKEGNEKGREDERHRCEGMSEIGEKSGSSVQCWWLPTKIREVT